MTEIRAYKPSDYEMVSSWWAAHGEQGPAEDMIPETSYIMVEENTPILAVSLFFTNSPLIWIDNYVANPEFKGEIRKQRGQQLLKYLELVAAKHGKNRLFCMSNKDKVCKRYEDMGFVKTLNNVNTFILEVK